MVGSTTATACDLVVLETLSIHSATGKKRPLRCCATQLRRTSVIIDIPGDRNARVELREIDLRRSDKRKANLTSSRKDEGKEGIADAVAM